MVLESAHDLHNVDKLSGNLSLHARCGARPHTGLTSDDGAAETVIRPMGMRR